MNHTLHTGSTGESPNSPYTKLKAFDPSKPYVPTGYERKRRAAANRNNLILARYRSLQNCVSKSEHLKSSVTGDLRERANDEIQRLMAAQIGEINQNSAKSNDFLVLEFLIPQTLKRVFGKTLHEGLTTAEIKELLGVNQSFTQFLTERAKNSDSEVLQVMKEQQENLVEPFLETLKKGQDEARKAKWSYRVGAEAEYLQSEGWYCFFITLTLDPKVFPLVIQGKNKAVTYQSPQDFWENSREFEYFRQRAAKVVCDTLKHPYPNSKHKLHNWDYYLKHFAVLEHGKSREHHHIHCMLWMRDIPASWKQCPNKGIAISHNRIHNQCNQMEYLWPDQYGAIKDFQYYRTVGDIWKVKHGFTIPIKDGKPMEIRPPAMAGAYMVKYLSKDDKEFNHRVKTTRGLGEGKLNAFMRRQSYETAHVLTWRPNSYQEFLEIQSEIAVPLGLIRQHAQKRKFELQNALGLIDVKREVIPRKGPIGAMIGATKEGDRLDRMSRSESYDWITQFLPQHEDYDHKKHLEAITQMGNWFQKTQRVGKRISIPGNDTGVG